MRKLLTALICILPSKLALFFLKMIGHNVSYKAKIGFSLIFVDKIIMSDEARIGHFNFIKINNLKFKPKAYIGHLNILKGPFDLNFDKQGAIGNSNKITRAPLGVTYGLSQLKMGELSKITANHRVDLTRSVFVGDFSTIAGSSSQIWTHGYLHASSGKGRIRIDGEVHIKNNVYIGSNCVINAGISINSAITVGSNSTVPKSLLKRGMYVGQGLRYLEKKDLEDVKKQLKKIDKPNLIDSVYEK